LITLMSALAMAQQKSTAPGPRHTGAATPDNLIDWPQFNFEPGLTGYNPFESALNASNVGSLTLKWRYPTPNGSVCSQAVIANGILYVGTDFAGVYALNADTGALLWNYATDGPVATPAVANGIVYVPGLTLYALDANTGALIWQVENDGQISPTVVNNVVYAGSNGGDLVALNAQTGAFIWRYSTGSFINSAAAVANGVAYVVARNGDVDALNANTGNLIWARHFGVSATPKPTIYSTAGGLSVANGMVYINVADFKSQYYVYALDANTGVTIWKSPSIGTGALPPFTPAVANGMVYAVANHNAYAFNAITGASIWQTSLSVADSISTIVANGVVYVQSWSVRGMGQDFYTIDALDASTGSPLWEHISGVYMPIRYPTPTVVNGMLYGTANDPFDLGTAIGAFGLPN
jgi:outer membrane protein assembly factor BamB